MRDSLIYLNSGDVLTVVLVIAMYLVIHGIPRWSKWNQERSIRKQVRAIKRDLDFMTKEEK